MMTTSHPTFSGPDVCRFSARKVVDLLRRGELSPADLLTAARQRMEQVEPSINATVIRDAARAEDAISRLPDRAETHAEHPGWLAGLTIAVKDLIDVAGLPSTCGNPALRDHVPTTSDPLIERLENRGAIIAGKTNTPEFGAGANTFNAVFGATRNPWNTSLNAGGSSGGAAASLATGEVWLSHGSDLAGSLRTPAAFCGVVGLRPSPGRCGGGPHDVIFSPMGVQGPMARDVADLALFLDTMAGFDSRQPLSIEEPATPFQRAVWEAPGDPVRIAFSEDQNRLAPVEPDIRAVLRGAMDTIQGPGIIVEEACPHLPTLYETFTGLRGIHFATTNAYLSPRIQQHFKKTLAENTAFGKALSGSRIFDAMRQRSEIFRITHRFLERYDVLAIPVTGIAPGPVEIEFPPAVDGEPVRHYIDWLRFSFLASTTGLPALSMPAGFTDQGLPVGLQLVGRPRGEAALLRIARLIEERLGLSAEPMDPVVAPPTQPTPFTTPGASGVPQGAP